jgi:3-oxoadipate enol-lactonase
MDLIRMNDPEKEAEPPAAGRLSELRAPVLLLVGEEDTPFIQDVARAIATQAPNVRRIDFPGVGHMVNLEAPERFRTAVLEFLAAPAPAP